MCGVCCGHREAEEQACVMGQGPPKWMPEMRLENRWVHAQLLEFARGAAIDAEVVCSVQTHMSLHYMGGVTHEAVRTASPYIHMCNLQYDATHVRISLLICAFMQVGSSQIRRSTS